MKAEKVKTVSIRILLRVQSCSGWACILKSMISSLVFSVTVLSTAGNGVYQPPHDEASPI